MSGLEVLVCLLASMVCGAAAAEAHDQHYTKTAALFFVIGIGVAAVGTSHW